MTSIHSISTTSRNSTWSQQHAATFHKCFQIMINLFLRKSIGWFQYESNTDTYGLNSGYNEYILHTFMLAYRRGGCSWKPLTSITKCSILDIAAALDSPVYREFKSTWNNTQRVKGKLKGIQGTSKNITYI